MCTHTYINYRLDTSAPCPDTHVKPNLQCDSIWKWGSRGVIRKLCNECDWCPCKADLRELFTMWRLTEKTAPYEPEGILTRNHICWCLDLGLFRLKNYEKYISVVYKPPGWRLWYFVIEANTQTHTHTHPQLTSS